MKIKSKIYIHPLYYIIWLIAFLTGHFKAFTVYTIIIIVHELGHILAGFVLKWPIAKITLYPFGALTTFDHKLNSSNLEEFFVLIYGPLFQILFYKLYPTPYHYFILLFNLLPIYPLDGSKLLFLCLNKVSSYYTSYIIIYFVSYLTIFILMMLDVNFLNYLVLLYLIYDVFTYLKKLPSIMLKFYFERYKDPPHYPHQHLIKGLKMKKMFKEKNNYFLISDSYYSETEVLRHFFN